MKLQRPYGGKVDARYLEALLQQIEGELRNKADKQAGTIFVGREQPLVYLDPATGEQVPLPQDYSDVYLTRDDAAATYLTQDDVDSGLRAFRTGMASFVAAANTDTPIPANAAFNIGGCYDNANHRFVPDVAGVYFFAANFSRNANGATTAPRIDIKVNGTAIASGLMYYTDYHGRGLSAAANLAEGDVVQATANGANGNATDMYQCSWSGFRIG